MRLKIKKKRIGVLNPIHVDSIRSKNSNLFIVYFGSTFTNNLPYVHLSKKSFKKISRKKKEKVNTNN